MSLRCRVEDQWVNTCPFPRRLEIGSKDPAAKGRPAQAVCHPGYNSKPDQGYLTGRVTIGEPSENAQPQTHSIRHEEVESSRELGELHRPAWRRGHAAAAGKFLDVPTPHLI